MIKKKLSAFFVKKLYVLKSSPHVHYLSDEALCELLIALGYIEVVEQYRWNRKVGTLDKQPK